MSAEWQIVSLGHLIEKGKAILQTGPFGTALKAAEYSDVGVPLISVREIREGFIKIVDETPRVSKETIHRLPKFVLKKGDIVFGRKGAVDRNSLITENEEGWFLGSDGIYLRLSEEYDAEYFSFVMRSPFTRAWLLQNCEGTTMPSLNQKVLSRIEVLIPQISIQKNISKILIKFDQKIQLNRQINQTLESMAQAIFQSWFVDFDPVKAKITAREQWQTLTDGERTEWLNDIVSKQAYLKTCLSELSANNEQSASETLYLNIAAMTAISSRDETSLADMPADEFAQLYKTASLFPERLVESELGEIPEGWEVTKVESILERIKVKSRYKKNEVIPYGKTPVYEQGADILLGFHDGEPSIIASIEKPAFIFGDHTCITHLACHSFDISQNVIPLRGACRASIWTYYAIRELQKFQEYRRHWSELIVKDICLPNKKITDNFSIFLRKLILKKEKMVTDNLDLTLMRDTLLPKLLSGELDVSTLTELTDIEPAAMDF